MAACFIWACTYIKQVPTWHGFHISLRHSRSVGWFHLATSSIWIMGACTIKKVPTSHGYHISLSLCVKSGLVSNGYPQPGCLFHMVTLPWRCPPHIKDMTVCQWLGFNPPIQFSGTCFKKVLYTFAWELWVQAEQGEWRIPGFQQICSWYFKENISSALESNRSIRAWMSSW